jgi:DNA repair ATPase RecN
VDLHVHSPASSDYSGDRNVSALEFVSTFVTNGFDLIAITDHNTGAFIDEALEARNKIASEDGKNITVLPGVELYVSPGIHLLAILPEGGSASISDLLSRLGLPVEQHGDTTKLISQSISEITRAVHERGGLLIGAHCNSTHGVVECLDGQTRLEWLRTIDALEIESGSEDGKIAHTIDYVTKSLGIPIPFVFGSDSHDCASANVGMWVKMADSTFTSLRQLIFEPHLRVSRSEPIAPGHGRVVGFTITHGIYADQRFRFSPHLNVLLGGRGAGKSAAIDLLRFAFEAEPKTGDTNNEVFTNRIMGFLQSVGEVVVVAIGTDGGTYVIMRSGTYEKPHARATAVFTDLARVYQVAGDQLVQREMRPLDVLGIEFYGQGEAARLANRVDEQMRLIDENLDHSDAESSIADAEQQLASDEKQLVRHKKGLEELRVEAATLPQLEERRNRLAQSLADPIFAERTRWDRERTWIQGQQDWVQDILDSLPGSIPTRSQLPIDFKESTAKAVLEKVREASDRILESSGNDLDRFRKMLTDALSELDSFRTEWNTAFDVAEKQYRARLAELGATNLAEIAAEHRGVEKELARIEADVQPEIERIESQINLSEGCRTTLLAKLRDARSAIASSRIDFVKELNLRLGGDVMVDLSGSDKSQYFAAIDGPLHGSGMMHREDQISLVCDRFTPDRFVEMIRTYTIEQLTEIGITENNASRMKNWLTEGVLYEIERIDVPQLPTIRIRREGETEYTDLSSLSVGEKCSAILSIALLSKGKALVIDQPEDDLDHAFIINSIVEGIRTAKSTRQIVAATHNPNIPVLGDAEMVFRVARRAGKDICYIQNSGGLELPPVTAEVQSLEGGAEAFERRRQRYSGVEPK